MTGIFCLTCKTFHERARPCSPRALKAAGGKESGEATGRRAVPSAPVPAKVGFTKRADAKPAPARPNRVPSGKSARAPQSKPKDDGIALTSTQHPVDKRGPTGHGLRGRGRLHKASIETVEAEVTRVDNGRVKVTILPVTTPHEALRKLEEIRARGAARAKKFRDRKKEAKNASA